MGSPDKTTIIFCLVVLIVWALFNIWMNHIMKRSRREMSEALEAAIEAAEEWQRFVEAHGEDDPPKSEREADGAVASRDRRVD